jgi:long-chain acyl-CoA synthetase
VTFARHIPAKPFPLPSWRLDELPHLLHTNRRNAVTYVTRDGLPRRCSFPEVRRDAIAALNQLIRSGVPLRSGARCAIMAPSGYDWLIAALACVFGGLEIVAVPETLAESDTALSLAGLPLDAAILSPEFHEYETFAHVPKVSIHDLAAPDDDPLVPLHPRVSVIAFTSGSTSTTKLKAFRIDPQSIEVFIESFARAFDLGHADDWVVCHPFSHIVHFEYALGGLAWGYNVTLTDTLSLVLHGSTLRPSILVTVPSVYE